MASLNTVLFVLELLFTAVIPAAMCVGYVYLVRNYRARSAKYALSAVKQKRTSAR